MKQVAISEDGCFYRVDRLVHCQKSHRWKSQSNIMTLMNVRISRRRDVCDVVPVRECFTACGCRRQEALPLEVGMWLINLAGAQQV